MRRLDDDTSSNIGATPDAIAAGNPYNLARSFAAALAAQQGHVQVQGQGHPVDVGAPGGMESAAVSISVSLSCSQENLNTLHGTRDATDSVIQSRENYANMLSVGTKFVPQARSFDSALSGDGQRLGVSTNEQARQCFVNAAHSFESTLPRFRSFDENLDGLSAANMFLEPKAPIPPGLSLSKSKAQSCSTSNVLDIPINQDRRRHSFGGNEERRDANIFAMRHSNSGDEPRRVLRKQIAIDVEDPLRPDLGGKNSPRALSGDGDVRGLSKSSLSSQQHVTVIKTPPNAGQSMLQYQAREPSSNVSSFEDEIHFRGFSPETDARFKPQINIISNEAAISSSYKRSHYLEPKDSLHLRCGFSSGSEDSPGPSSREPSPFRKESVRAVSPYSKERYKLSTPTPVIKTQVKKEASEIGYEFNKQSSSGSSDAGSGSGTTFPDYCANIVITSETGESVKCKTEDVDTLTLEVPEGMHRRHVHPGNFKKHLHARYLKSLRGSYSSSSTDTSLEYLSQDRSDSFNRSSSDVFDSTENEHLNKDAHLHAIFLRQNGSSETSDDNDIQMESVIKASPRSGDSPEQQPLDLSQDSSTGHIPRSASVDNSLHKPVINTPRAGLSPHGSAARSHLGLHPHSDPELLSPSMIRAGSPFQRSTHLQPQMVSPSPVSPLCSVPEGNRIFQFNFGGPFEGAHIHSDPEFGSPMSPGGLHFTFPPRATMLSAANEVNRLAVSPRAYYPNQTLLQNVGGHVQQVTFDGMINEQRRTLSDSEAYLCPVCGQVFPSYDNLAKHMAKHLPTETIRSGDNKIHYCKVCERSFSRSDMLTRHMRLHTGLKPYECSDCGQVFSRSDHLNTHRRTHTGEKPYRCPQCPYAACRRDMITRHMRTHNKRSAKRGKFLSVPERESRDVRKGGSLSSTDTTSSQDLSARTFSASSGESLDLDPALIAGRSPKLKGKKISNMGNSMNTTEMEFQTSKPPLWSSRSAESGSFDEIGQGHGKAKGQLITQSRSFESRFDGDKYHLSAQHFRQIRQLSANSFDSFDSHDDILSRTDSIADDSISETTICEDQSATLPIEPESMEKCSIVERTGESVS